MKNGKQGEGGGRPKIVLTEEQLAEIGTLAPYLTADQLADTIGISRSKFFEILQENEEVSGLYKKAKGKAVANVANNLVLQAQNGNTTAAIFYLKTQAGWKETERHELVGADDEPLVWKIRIMGEEDATSDSK
jgi:hypothetical protein|tara:strand:+ start:256 stop:654 length:399 start_codon:yes stop_codon:yes gene_type:complete